MGNKLDLTNTQFLYERNGEPIKNAFVYLDLPGTPEEEPKFKLTEFTTDKNGKIGFVKKPSGTVWVIQGETYNVYYSLVKKDIKTITESMCKKIKMEPIVKIKAKLDSKEDLHDGKVVVIEYDEGAISIWVKNNHIDWGDFRIFIDDKVNVKVEIVEKNPSGKATKKSPLKKIIAPNSEHHLLNIIFTKPSGKYTPDSEVLWGDPNAKAKDNYTLPYPKGDGYTVTQGFNGSKSHKKPINHAIDFDMPKGSTVCAGRDGVVVDSKDVYAKENESPGAGESGNFVRILHSDRTYSFYCHLQKGGIPAKVANIGAEVKTGDVIGKSGNTGSSSKAHLHFDVRVPGKETGDFREWKTVPWKAKDSSGKVFVPKKGVKYTN